MLYKLSKWTISTISISFILFVLSSITIFQNKFFVKNLLTQLKYGSLFEDPFGWDKHKYGFQEDKDKALFYYKKGYLALVEKSLDVYDVSMSSPYTSKKLNPHIRWETYSKSAVLEYILLFFRDLTFACDLEKFQSFYKKWSLQEDLSSISMESHFAHYQLTKEKIHELKEWLFSLDKKYFYLAMQKKPDLWAVLSLREDIMYAICQPKQGAHLWYTAVEYVRYRTEKNIYNNLSKGVSKDQEQVILPKYFALQVQDSLEKDILYHKFLKVFYNKSLQTTTNVDWHIKSAQDILNVMADEDVFNSYLESILIRCKTSSIYFCKVLYKRLFEWDKKNVENNFHYVYTLAELAYQSKQYTIAQKFFRQLATSPLSERDNSRYMIVKKRLYILSLFLE